MTAKLKVKEEDVVKSITDFLLLSGAEVFRIKERIDTGK